MNIFVQGHYYENNNYGDTLIERAVKKQLTDIFESINLKANFVGGENPDIFICGGGGMYSDWQEEAPDTWLPPIKRALEMGTPCIAYGIGAGPICNIKRFSELFDKFKLITVRDSFSKDFMKNAIVTADPVALHYGIPQCSVNLVDISTMPKHKAWCKELVAYLECFIDVRPDILWEIHREFNEEVCNKKTRPMNIDMHIGMQMHGIMTKAMGGTPTVALIYHPKCCLPLDNIIAYCNVGDGMNWKVLDTPLSVVKTIIKAMPKDLRYRCRAYMNMVLLKNFLIGESNERAIAVSHYLNEE